MNWSGNTLHQRVIKILVPYASWPLVPFQGLLHKLAHIHCESSIINLLLCSTDCCSDVLRRRFQINTMSGIGYQYKSIFDAIRVIVRQEGIKGLYKGLVPNLLKVAPSMASSWLSFEMPRDFLVSLKPITEDL
jgi:hypothetical protein